MPECKDDDDEEKHCILEEREEEKDGGVEEVIEEVAERPVWDLGDTSALTIGGTPDEIEVIKALVMASEHFFDLEDPTILASLRGVDASAVVFLEKQEEKEPAEALIAESMAASDVIDELLKRGVASSGFRDEDVERLQPEFDSEWVERKTALLEQKLAMDVSRRASTLVKKHREAVKSGFEEEVQLLKRSRSEDESLAEWLLGRQTNELQCSSVLRGVGASVAARLLAKTLYGSRHITTLDLSRAGLDDQSGAYLARSLAGSRVIKLDLDDNQLATRTCTALAEIIKDDQPLRSLSLEGNKLLAPPTDIDLMISQLQGAAFKGEACVMGLESLCCSLSSNRTLTRLSVWRCSLTREAGVSLSTGVASSCSLLLVETGQNELDIASERSITETLQKNRLKAQQDSEQLREAESLKESSAKLRLEDQKATLKAKDVQIFLERRKMERQLLRVDKDRRLAERETEDRKRREAKERVRRNANEKIYREKAAQDKIKKRESLLRHIDDDDF